MFSNALKHGWGSKKFLQQIRAASQGDYTPRNYTQYEIDLSILLYELGGGGAVYAMNHSIFALPSLNTLQPYRRQHKPKPCIDHVDLLSISDNIATVFGPHEEKGGTDRQAPKKISHHATRVRVSTDLMHYDPRYCNHNPELERKARRLKLVRARDVDHIGPREWEGEISAGSCDIDACYESGVEAAEEILRNHSVLVPKSFKEHFKKDTDLLRPFGGKYPAISTDIDRSRVNTSNPSGASGIDPEAIVMTGSINPICQFDFHARMARDESQRAAISHDRLQRVRGFTIGGKSWAREESDSEIVSPSTHFQLGNLFATFICYNGTHLGLVFAKTTPDEMDVFVSELESPENNISFSSEREKAWVFPNDPILAAWHSLRRRIETDNTLHDKIPVFNGVNNGIFPYQAARTENFQGVIYAFSIVDTPISDAIANRQACRVCGKTVKDTDRQTHMGQHIRKALRGIQEDSVKCPVAEAYPCGTCGRSMNDGICQLRIKSGKVDSDCPSTYAFRISSAAEFRQTRPCTNIPLQCPLNCNHMHWKYNFPMHLEAQHPTWRQLVSPKFIEQITVTRAEELALGIPEAKARPLCPPPASPRAKENEEPQNKVPRLELPGLPGSHVSASRT
ncbi:hypothetical protein FB451DRAFT_1491961 [Mycena latifolia]|nr:hypothetical protein FB451DRAFT_1491961 [Mycena latifolia]